MKKCPTCGHQNERSEMKCPACGNYYSKVIELIDEEEKKEKINSFRGRCKRILNSENVRRELITELKTMKAHLSIKAKFTIFVIFIFVFALIVSVL